MTNIQQTHIEAKVDRIITLLQGDDLDDNDTGMIGKIYDMDDRLKKLETMRDRFFWMIIGMSIPAGYGLSQILSILLK